MEIDLGLVPACSGQKVITGNTAQSDTDEEGVSFQLKRIFARLSCVFVPPSALNHLLFPLSKSYFRGPRKTVFYILEHNGSERNRRKHCKNSHLMIHFPTSSGVRERVVQVNEQVAQSLHLDS